MKKKTARKSKARTPDTHTHVIGKPGAGESDYFSKTIGHAVSSGKSFGAITPFDAKSLAKEVLGGAAPHFQGEVQTQ